MSALERAQQDIEQGSLWKARDRLQGFLQSAPADQDALVLLARLYARMGDLPAAGRNWYLTEELESGEAAAAREAFEERCGHRADQILALLPLRGPLENYPSAVQERVRELADAAGHGEGWWSRRFAAPRPRGPRRPPPGGVAHAFGTIALCLATFGVWILGWVFLARAVF